MKRQPKPMHVPLERSLTEAELSTCAGGRGERRDEGRLLQAGDLLNQGSCPAPFGGDHDPSVVLWAAVSEHWAPLFDGYGVGAKPED